MKKYKLKNIISGNIIIVDESKLEKLKENISLYSSGKFIFEVTEEKEKKPKKEKPDATI